MPPVLVGSDERRPRRMDAAMFVAVLVVGLVLILGMHASPDTLALYFAALASLYVAWRSL